MAFRSNSIGPYLAAWSDENTLYVESPSGIKQFAVPFNVIIPKQRWYFYSEYVIFYLETEDMYFAGRRDGTFSGVRKRDNVLTRFGKWAPPSRERFEAVGSYSPFKNGPVHAAVRSKSDNRVVYIEGTDKVFILKELNDLHPTVYRSISDSMKGNAGLQLYDLGMEVNVDAAGEWFVPSLEGRTSDRVFL